MKKILLSLLIISTLVFADTPPPKNTDQLKEGATNLYFTNPRADARITVQKGAANGLATLDGAGKVPAAQLPSGGGGTWGSITGTLSDQTDLQSALNAKYDASNPSGYINSAGAPVQSVAGKTGTVSLVKGDVGLGNVDNTSDANKPISTATQTALNAKEPSISAGTTLQYWRGDKSFQTLNTLAVPELTNLYWTQARFDTAFGAKSTTNLSEGTNLYFTDARAVNAVFSRLNYIPNPDAEVDTSFWNLYNDSGRTVSAFVVDQDITYTSTTSGGGGNGQTVTYSLAGSSYSEPPTITCPTGNSVSVTWYNGPTLAQNPTATVLKAAWDASCAATMATATITGTASNRQYQTGTVTLGQGGDTAPVDGTGGSPSGVTFTRSTSSPLVGAASFDLGKDANSEQGQGVSTDFSINSADRGNTLQLSLFYSGLSGFVFGSSSDVQAFLYDKTNAVMLPLTKKTFSGTTGNVFRFAAQFTASATSTDYRLIFHIATVNASSWDLKLDSVTVNATLDSAAATDVPKLMLNAQPINGSVTDHMAVMWTDGASAWVPATMASATDFTTLYGFATNLVGLTANITLRGALNGFSFGPFVGYNQYVDNTAGGISPLPASFTDAYVVMGKGLTSDTIMVEPKAFNRLITSKGGLLTNGGLNNGTGDVVLAGGTTGQFLMGNTALTNGIAWNTPVATAPLNYTASTHTWAMASTSQNFIIAGPTSGSGAPTARAMVAADVPTLNQNTTGSAATWTTARNLAGNSVNGSANVAFANKFIVQGTADAGLSSAQFMGALGTGIVKNTTTTGVQSIAVAGDFPTLNQNTSGSAASLSATLAIGSGGTGQTTANAAFNALSPMTTLGDIEYEDATPKAVRLSGNTTTTKKFLNQTGNGSISAAPVWTAPSSDDVTNSSGVTGASVTNALNTLNTSVNEVQVIATKNAGSVTANTTIPTWTTVNQDTNSNFVGSTGVFTATVAGDYNVKFNAATTSGTPVAQVYYNGALFQSGVGSGVRTSVSTTIPNVAVNDTITVALDSSLTLTSTTTDNILSISKVSGANVPIVQARYHGATGTITSSLSNITFSTKDFDSASAYSGATFTVPATTGAGVYNYTACIYLTATTVAASNVATCAVLNNAAIISESTRWASAAATKPQQCCVTDTYKFANSDAITVQASFNGTTNSISASNVFNYFSIYKVSN